MKVHEDKAAALLPRFGWNGRAGRGGAQSSLTQWEQVRLLLQGLFNLPMSWVVHGRTKLMHNWLQQAILLKQSYVTRCKCSEAIRKKTHFWVRKENVCCRRSCVPLDFSQWVAGAVGMQFPVLNAMTLKPMNGEWWLRWANGDVVLVSVSWMIFCMQWGAMMVLPILTALKGKSLADKPKI